MSFRERILRQRILSNVINILILNIADEYLIKLKKDKKNPPKLIQDYLNKSVILTEKKIKIKNINSKIQVMNEETSSEFKKILEENKEYEELVKKLNFVFNLIKSEDLQKKVVDEIYNDFIKFKEKNETIKKQKERIFNLNWFFKKNYNFAYIVR